MSEKWKGKGLSVLGVTDEGVSDTEKWIANKGAQYGYAYDKGGKLQRFFGVRGIPHAVLIDASGTVVWRGHPGTLEESSLEGAVRGTLAKPVWEWSGAAKGVKVALQKRAYKSALDQAMKLGAADNGAEIVASIQEMVKARVDAMKGAFEKGDFLGAQTAAVVLEKELAGLGEASESTKVVADITADKQALSVIKGQQKVAKIRATEMTKRKDLVAGIDALRKIKTDYAGTYVETEVTALIKQLNDMADGM